MPSAALADWRSTGLDRLKELEKVHTRATGTARGRRWGTEQLNRSFFVALVGQFQSYCRALQDEAVGIHVQHATAEQKQIMRTLMTQARKLDVGNPRREALGSDFALLGLTLIPDLKALGAQTRDDLDSLDLLVDFRNAISHGDDPKIASLIATGHIKATKKSYIEYRKTLDRLAGTIDGVVAAKLSALLNIPVPW